MTELIVALSPLVVRLFHEWRDSGVEPTAEFIAAELHRLVEQGDAEGNAAIAAIKARLAANQPS